MNTVRSAGGTIISCTRGGQGPPLILVNGALCSRSFPAQTQMVEAQAIAPVLTGFFTAND